MHTQNWEKRLTYGSQKSENLFDWRIYVISTKVLKLSHITNSVFVNFNIHVWEILTYLGLQTNIWVFENTNYLELNKTFLAYCTAVIVYTIL